MKTTIDLPDSLLNAAKATAAKERTTLRALVEEGLRVVLARRRGKERFVLEDASVDGNGLHPEIREGDWSTIRDLAYEGRGA